MKNQHPCLREALLYKKKGDFVICNTCERRCEIPLENRGFCETRKNIEGQLYTLEYGDISSLSVNPIEKKPFFHFYPGSYALTIGSWSCNFTCPWCQNHEISKTSPNLHSSNYLSPQNFIKLVKEEKCHGTSISFNEPTLLFEYSLEVFELARKEGYYNTYVTNGYMTPEALKMLIEYGLNGINFDVKGDEEAVRRYCGVDVEKVWKNIRLAHHLGAHIEITTLIIPGVNDNDECLQYIAQRIKREGGADTPWHLTQYYPAYKALEAGLSPQRTPLEILEKAWELGKKEGLRYVYLGNVAGHRYENTYCPNCHELLMKRFGVDVIGNRILTDNTCPKCKEEIPIIGEKIR